MRDARQSDWEAPFLAHLTASGAAEGTTGYTWEERAYNQATLAPYAPHSPRGGTLTAFEINGSAVALPCYAILQFRSLNLDSHPTFQFQSGGGPGNPDDEDDPGEGGEEGDPPCVITDRKTECVAGRDYIFTRTISLLRGCLEASEWALAGPAGCEPIWPPCAPVLSYRYVCLPYPGDDPGVTRDAELVSRTYHPAGGCPVQTPYTFSRWTGKCCDCPPDEPTCPPCDDEDGIDTDCCDGVPCELCLQLTAAGDCAETFLTLTYDDSTPIDFGGELLCGWTAAPFAFGDCEFTAAVVCKAATSISPAGFWMMLTDTASGVSLFAPMALSGCSPLQASASFPIKAGFCCGADNVTITATLTPAPCDEECVPEAACAECPDGGPLAFTADFTILAAVDAAFADLSGVQLLTWRGGCVWVAGAGDCRAILAFDSGTWVLTVINDVTGEMNQTEVSDFVCCDGGTFTSWTFGATSPDITLIPVPGTCCGGSGPPVSGCCDPPPPATLYAHFTGSLLALGAVTLTYDGGTGSWSGTTTGCGGGPENVTFHCNAVTGIYECSVPGPVFLSGTVIDCDPFEWSGSGTATGSCPGTGGAFTVTILETP